MLRRSVLVPVAIFVVTAAVFVPALQHEFLNWGDEPALTANERYRSLGWNEIKWMFTTFYTGHYQPLAWATFAADHYLWGLDPFGFHLTNVVLHGLNAVVFYFICRRLFSLALPGAMAGKTTPTLAAFFSALAFSIHPLRVGSVAWASQRGDLLAALFILLTILLYLERAADRTSGRPYRLWMFAALFFYALSLLSRASGMVLPFVFLALDVYPLRRLRSDPGKWFQPQDPEVLREKIPFAALASLFALAALMARQEAGALKLVESQNSWAGPAEGLLASLALVWKTFLPAGPASVGELSSMLGAGAPLIALAVLVALCAAAGALFAKRGWRLVPVVWTTYLSFVGAIFVTPVSGLPPDAERLSYLACLGWAVLMGSALFYWRPGGTLQADVRRRLAAGSVAGCVVLIFLGVMTLRQTKLWQDSETFWRHAAAIQPESATAHYYLGLALNQQGVFQTAEELFRRSLEKQPSAEAYSSLGDSLIRSGKPEQAMQQFREALKIDPTFAKALSGLGVLLARQGLSEEALPYLHEAAARRPGDAQIRYDLAIVLATTGELGAAAEHFLAAVRLKPDHTQAHYNLGVVLADQGRLQEAMRHFRKTLEIDGAYARAHHQLALLLDKDGRVEEAVGSLRRALQLEPELAEAHENLGRILVRLGRRDEAVHHLEEAVRIARLRPVVQALP